MVLWFYGSVFPAFAEKQLTIEPLNHRINYTFAIFDIASTKASTEAVKISTSEPNP